MVSKFVPLLMFHWFLCIDIFLAQGEMGEIMDTEVIQMV